MELATITQTASAASCARVWQSIGVATEVLLWLGRGEVAQLQLLNVFWYQKAVSRVQTRFTLALRKVFLFVAPSIEDKVYKVETRHMKIKTKEDYLFDFDKC